MRLGGRRRPRAASRARARRAGTRRAARRTRASVAHRVAADQRRAGDDAIGEERAPRRREEVALVAPRARRTRGCRCHTHRRARATAPLADRLRDRVPSGRSQRKSAAKPSRIPAAAKTSPSRSGARTRAARARASRRRRRGEGARRRAPAALPRRRRARRSAAGSAGAPRAARARRRLLEVQALREMRDRRGEHDGDRELPRAPAPARERAREPDQRDPEGERDDAGARSARRAEARPARSGSGSANSGVSAEAMLIAPTSGGGAGEQRLGPGHRTSRGQGTTPAHERRPLPRGSRPCSSLTAGGLVPWTLWLTFTLPSRHVTSTTTSRGSSSTCALFCADRGHRVVRRTGARSGSSRSQQRPARCSSAMPGSTSSRRSAAVMRSRRSSRRCSRSCRSPRSARSSSTTPNGSSRFYGAARSRSARAGVADARAARRGARARRARRGRRGSSSSTSDAAAPTACSESFAWPPRTRAGQLDEELPSASTTRRYRARPCGLVRRRWRRFSRRACAPGSDGEAWMTSTSSGVGSAASACSDSCERAVPASSRRAAAAAVAPTSSSVAGELLALRELRLALLPDRQRAAPR